MHASIYSNGRYLRSNPHWHAEDAPIKAGWIDAILQRNAVVPRRIVDEGCGSGDILVQLAKLYPAARLEGYDISPQAHLIAAPKTGDRLAFHLGRYAPAKGEEADLLMAIDVIEHVEDYLGFVREAKRKAVLKLFHIPLDLSVQGLLRGAPLMTARREVGHLHYFCRDTALATLRECGHQIIDWNYTHPAETMAGSFRTKMFNGPRRLMRWIHADLGVRVMGGASLMVLTR